MIEIINASRVFKDIFEVGAAIKIA